MNISILGQIAGIDFGTSNSSVGVFRNGNPELLELRDEGRTVPSAIFYSTETAEVTYGRRAVALATVIDHQLGHALARTVESAKIELSTLQSASIRLDGQTTPLVNCEVSRVDMEEAIGSAVAKLGECVNEGLAKADVQAQDIVSVFYTGGSSSVPCLRLAFEQQFPNARHTSGDIFGSVGLGLTVDAARRFA